MRVAVYFTPAQDDPLTQRAAQWLGRDAFTGRRSRDADPAIDPLVTGPARYGFHATLKAPFRLAEGRTLADLEACAMRFSQSLWEIQLGAPSLTRLGTFFALTVPNHAAALASLEESVRAAFDPLRAPPSEADLARRRSDNLSPRQQDQLLRWGYPHVGPDFRFHMTLTDAIDDPDEARTVEAQLRDHLGHLLRRPITIDALALFTEAEPGAPFLVHSRHPLRVPTPIGVFAP